MVAVARPYERAKCSAAEAGVKPRGSVPRATALRRNGTLSCRFIGCWLQILIHTGFPKEYIPRSIGVPFGGGTPAGFVRGALLRM